MWYGIIGALLVSACLAEGSFRQGQWAYKTGFYLSLANLVLSFGALFVSGGPVTENWEEDLGVCIAAVGGYFLFLGLFVSFRRAKNVKCFRCNYVGLASETDESFDGHREAEWRSFQNLDAEYRLAKRDKLK